MSIVFTLNVLCEIWYSYKTMGCMLAGNLHYSAVKYINGIDRMKRSGNDNIYLSATVP
jgi:hypothetical protein